jgi:hypothetical protein
MGVGHGRDNSQDVDRFLENLSKSSATDRVDALVRLAVSQPDTAYALLAHTISSPQELVSFIERVSQKRGLGSGLKKALTKVLSFAPAEWFVGLAPIKSLDGSVWSWRKLVQILHPKGNSFGQELRFAYMAEAIPEAGRPDAERLLAVIGIGSQNRLDGGALPVGIGLHGGRAGFDKRPAKASISLVPVEADSLEGGFCKDQTAALGTRCTDGARRDETKD